MAITSPDDSVTIDNDEKPQDAITATSGPGSPTDSSRVQDADGNLIYGNAEDEPELHLRTWVAIGALIMSNTVQVMALQGPPSVLSFIGQSLDNLKKQIWVPDALSLVQAVLGPVFSSASDTFQARKIILVTTSLVAFVGCAVAPGSQSIYRLIAAQVLTGVGFAAVPLTYCVPSEIAPRRWRPAIQAALNVGASLGAIAAPLIIGSFTRADRVNGWRNFYWVQMALWGVTALGILLGYRPPKRHTRLDHMTLAQKIGQLDLIGFFLLTAGLTLFLTGLISGGGVYSWTSAQVLGTLVTGLIVLLAFGLYEWKGTSTGILHHDLFKGDKGLGRTFTLCVALIAIEGILLFAWVIIYPTLTRDLYESEPFLLVARGTPYWIACLIGTILFGYASTRLKIIRAPLFIGYLIFTAGVIGFATLQPADSTSAIAFAALSGLGFGAPLILIVAGVQLSTPHHLIATATAVTTSARAVAAAIFTAIYAAAITQRQETLVPQYVSAAALRAGLPAASLPSFLVDIAAANSTQLASVAGATAEVINAALAAQKQALADSLRVVWIIAAPFGALACVLCYFLGDLRATMNYRVDAPVEGLHAKRNGEKS